MLLVRVEAASLVTRGGEDNLVFSIAVKLDPLVIGGLNCSWLRATHICSVLSFESELLVVHVRTNIVDVVYRTDEVGVEAFDVVGGVCHGCLPFAYKINILCFAALVNGFVPLSELSQDKL